MDPTDVFKNNLGHWIKRVDQTMTMRINELLRPFGLARSQWEVLFRIASVDGITQKDLQVHMHVESGTLTGIVDALVRKGWVGRQEHARDRRVKLLKMTPSGMAMWGDVPNPIHVLRPQMMEGISPEEEHMAVRLLKTAAANLNAPDEEGNG